MLKYKMPILFVLLVAVLSFFLMERNKVEKDSVSLFRSFSVEEKSAVIEKENAINKNQENAGNGFTYREQKIIKDWMNLRGYVNKNDQDIYQNYDGKILKELAEKGDLIAIDVLADRHFKKNDIQNGKNYLKLAAIFGSTPALSKLTAFSAPAFSGDKTEELRRSAVIETLAIAKVIEMRGDPGLAINAVNDLNNSYERLYGEKQQLTLNNADVNARANELYGFLVDARRERGLGDFDNGYPKEVERFYGLDE